MPPGFSPSNPLIICYWVCKILFRINFCTKQISCLGSRVGKTGYPAPHWAGLIGFEFYRVGSKGTD